MKWTSPCNLVGVTGQSTTWIQCVRVSSVCCVLDMLCSAVMGSVLDTHNVLQFLLHFPSLVLLCAIL